MTNLRALMAIAIALALPLLLAGCGGDSDSGTSSKSFAPEATLRAVGGTVRTDQPDFVLHVETRKGDANLRSVEVVLPPVALVDAGSIGTICSRAEFKSDRCKDRKRLGFARVHSPAYDGVLAGDVFAVSGGGRLPKLAYVLG